jgi:hypothetical protein
MGSPDFPRDTPVSVILVATLLLSLVTQSSVGASRVYSQAERMFILGHYFASKSFDAVREAFSDA